MAKRPSVDEELAALDALPAERDAQVAALRKALASKQHRVVAKAAAECADALHYDLVPALIAAYPRFLDKPVKLDPACYAKKAIVRALVALDCDDVELYLAGLRYRQLEPVWGGTQDTAVDVRCNCAMGLVSSGYSRALVEVAELLNDADPAARCGAARAVACGNPREAELLLRAKVVCGDAEPAVLGECFSGLLTAAPEESIPFVARYLEDRDEAVCELAALALGESRRPAALPPLQAAWQRVLPTPSFRRALARAAAAHRSDAAYDWLLTLVAEARAATATDIIEALAAYKHNTKLAQRVQAVLADRGDQALLDRFTAVWQ